MYRYICILLIFFLAAAPDVPCGQRHVTQAQPRVVGGFRAAYGAFPWQAGIQVHFRLYFFVAAQIAQVPKPVLFVCKAQSFYDEMNK